MTAKSALAATLALTLLAATGVSAGDRGMRGDHFEKADTNGDGNVTEAEFTAALKSHFDKFDTNKDGKIALAELPQQMPAPEGMKEKMQGHYDKMVEKKGKEAADKMMERASKGHSRVDFVARFDRDKDEVVSLEEFTARPMKHFKRADANGDGQVTADEMAAAKAKMHDRWKKKAHHEGHEGSPEQK